MASRTIIRRKNLKKGIQFTIMVTGCPGLGRTSFVNTLCDRTVLSDTSGHEWNEGEMRIRPVTVDLEEEGVKISLTVVDTPGFGTSIDNEHCFKTILEYIERQYDDILAEESRIKRNPKFRDNRVHVLLYFITPTGHALRELDIEFMKQLGPRVNIIPVIGRSDSMTRTELAAFKQRVMEDVEHYDIPIYSFPYDVEEDDEDTVEENAELRGLMPFALISGRAGRNGSDEPERERVFKWGTAQVDNTEHCDFAKLRYALLSSHLNDLKEITHDFLYENYRTEKLSRDLPEGALDEEDEDGEGAEMVRIRQDHLRQEEEKLRERNSNVQREIAESRQALLRKEEALRTLESRMTPA